MARKVWSDDVKKGAKNPFRIINRALRDAGVKNLGVSEREWGVRAEDGRWVLTGYCACPLGICLVGKKRRGNDNVEQAVTRVIGKPLAWVRSFIDGVDNNEPDPRGSKQAYAFGQRVRAKHITA